jgi:hypothetical protein
MKMAKKKFITSEKKKGSANLTAYYFAPAPLHSPKAVIPFTLVRPNEITDCHNER